MQRLEHKHFSGFIKNLVLVFRLNECRRDDHHDVIDGVIKELVKPDGQLAIAEVLSSPSRVVRRQSYRLSMMAKGLHKGMGRGHYIHRRGLRVAAMAGAVVIAGTIANLGYDRICMSNRVRWQ